MRREEKIDKEESNLNSILKGETEEEGQFLTHNDPHRGEFADVGSA